MSHQVHPPNGHLSKWIVDQFPPGYRGHAIDVGASDGISINTTYLLEHVHQWTVLSCEPNPFFHHALLKHRAFVEKCAVDKTAGEATFHVHADHPEAYSSLRVTMDTEKRREMGKHWQAIRVQVRTVDELLARWQFPKLDALTVDVEGTELDVLKGCDLAKWKPRVVIAESWKDPDPLLDGYLATQGYGLAGTNVHNRLYVRTA